MSYYLKIEIIIYLIFSVYFLIMMSRKNVLTIFSPALLFISFILTDIFPMLVPQPYDIPQTVYRNTMVAIPINIVFMLVFRNVYLTKPNINIYQGVCNARVNRKRIQLIWACLGVLLFSGLVSGTLIGFLRGQDMENQRRVAEVGIGFLRDLPTIILIPSVLVLLMYKYKTKYKKAALICLLIGVFSVAISGGNRGPLLLWANVYLAYFTLTNRGLRVYEYLLYLAAYNVGGVILGLIRKGLTFNHDGALSSMTWFDVFAGNQNVFYHNSILLVDFCEKNKIFFYGEELYNNAVYFIPRFLWPDKPVSFGYKLKDLLGWTFDGGGIGATYLENTYLNWGDMWWINYILWYLSITLLYKYFLKIKWYSSALLFVYLFLVTTREIELIKSAQLLLLSMVVYYIYYRHKKII